jgi:predicted aconitase with swiveling domain
MLTGHGLREPGDGATVGACITAAVRIRWWAAPPGLLASEGDDIMVLGSIMGGLD